MNINLDEMKVYLQYHFLVVKFIYNQQVNVQILNASIDLTTLSIQIDLLVL